MLDGQNKTEIQSDNEKSFSLKADLFEWFDVFSVVLVIIVLCFSFLFKVATIQGESMQKTLFENEKVIISNFLYEPKYGDIVVISRNVDNTYLKTDDRDTMPIIKRVIATEGQKVGIDFEKGIVYVDGKPLDEPYTNTPTNLRYDIEYSVKNPVTVPKGYVFVMGDNRNNSLDSRSTQIGNNGMIDKRYILGHTILRIYPFNKFGGLTKK